MLLLLEFSLPALCRLRATLGTVLLEFFLVRDGLCLFGGGFCLRSLFKEQNPIVST